MSTTTVTIKYRPLRIGLLVREGNLEDLIEAAGLNTLIIGGMYNPILPISGNSTLSESLVELFNVDVLYPVARTDEVNAFLEQHKNLRSIHNYSSDFFYEEWKVNGKKPVYLDIMNTIEFFWDTEFKHRSKKFKSAFCLIKWAEDDPLSNLFSLNFGYFPKKYGLAEDFEKAFFNGLRAKEYSIEKGSEIDDSLNRTISPIHATAMELEGYGGTFKGHGVYLGDEASFYDLISYWNLRAAGIIVGFVPLGSIERYEKRLKALFSSLDKLQSRPAHIEDWITIYFQPRTEDRVRELIKGFHTRKEQILHPCEDVIWNGLNVKAAQFYFNWQQTLASVEDFHGRTSVIVDLRGKPPIIEKARETFRQELAVSIDSFYERAYQLHTLRPPYISSLNEFFAEEIALYPSSLRVEREGIGVTIGADSHSLTLYPLSDQKLIFKMFEFTGIHVETRTPGLLANQIIHKLGGVESGSFFKLSGVRKLIQDLRPDQSIDKGEATKIIWADGQFKKNMGPYSNPDRAFYELLKHDFFRGGLDLVCEQCQLKNWLPLSALNDYWLCNYCGKENQTSLQLNNRGDWRFRKSGLLATDNNQEGAIPVILTLKYFHQALNLMSSKFIYSTALNLKINNVSCETDLCILHYGRRDSLEVGIAECKSQGGNIDQKDIDNLIMVREQFIRKGINCFLILSKTANEFRDDEIQRFKNTSAKHVPMILLLNRELELFNPYEGSREKGQPYQYPHMLEEMAANSYYLYLKE